MTDEARLRSRRDRPPWPLAVPAVFATAFLMLPLVTLAARAPWSGLTSLIGEPMVLSALRLSLVCATAAAGISLVLGVPLAWVLARSDSRAGAIVRAMVMVPLVLPPVVGGVALLTAFGRRGAVGAWLDSWFGVTLPFTTAGAIIAETFVALPFLVVSVEGAFRGADRGLEEAARTLGSGRLATFRRVSVPLVLPSIIAGTVLAWARALGEFGATITFAGNTPGRTQTMPLAVYLAMETDPQAAMALSMVLLLVAVLVLFSLRGQWMVGGRGP